MNETHTPASNLSFHLLSPEADTYNTPHSAAPGGHSEPLYSIIAPALEATTSHVSRGYDPGSVVVGSVAYMTHDAAGREEEEVEGKSHAVTFLLIAISVFAFVALLMSLILFVVRRSKLDKIRHHLMPMYNFDPTDEEPHWETDLLEDDREQQMALNIPSSTSRPKLKFHSHGAIDA